MRRGDNIPSVSDYSHWNEDAQLIWYEENKYDMQHWDEEMEDPDEWYRDEEEDPDEAWFDSEKDARKFYESLVSSRANYARSPRQFGNSWYVEYIK